jgi:hypothetical protein
MNHIIKQFLVTFNFCYIRNMSRLTLSYEVNLVNITLHFCEKCLLPTHVKVPSLI